MNDNNNQIKPVTQFFNSNLNSGNILPIQNINSTKSQYIKSPKQINYLALNQNSFKQKNLENPLNQTQNEKKQTHIKKNDLTGTNQINPKTNQYNNNNYENINKGKSGYINNGKIYDGNNNEYPNILDNSINNNNFNNKKGNKDINMNYNTNKTQKNNNDDNNSKFINLNNMNSNISNLESNNNISSQTQNNGKNYNENTKINNNYGHSINSNNINNFHSNKQKNEQQVYNNINNNNNINMINNNNKFNNNINENIINNQMSNPNFNINVNPINQNVDNYKMNSNSNTYSFSRYTKASQTGLENINDTSYLNSVIQLLGSIRNIASYFLNPKHQKIIVDDIKHYPLSFVFYRLFLHLYPYPEPDNRVNYKPDSLLEVLGILNVVYKTTKARNPNELISFILNRLHKEININKNNKFQPSKYNIYDKKSVINAGIYNFQKSDNSVISNALNWFEIKELRCNKCNQIVYNFNTFNTFELDILGAYQCKKNPITLNECLYYYGKEKAQDLYCIKCGKYNKITYKSNILSSSYMIIFSLNRGELDKNNLIHIPFHLEDKIDLSFFIEKESPKHYELTGIVSAVKEQNKYKYVSFCKSPVDHQWYLYNDKIIGKPQLNDIINAHNNNKYIPCILAYTQY